MKGGVVEGGWWVVDGVVWGGVVCGGLGGVGVGGVAGRLLA